MKLTDYRLFVKWETPMAGSTPGYIPEACLLVPAQDRRFSHKTDLYTLGIVFVELMAELVNPLYDVTVYPVGWRGENYEWNELDPAKRQQWLMEEAKKSGYAKVDRDVLPRDSPGWKLCEEVYPARCSGMRRVMLTNMFLKMWAGTNIEGLMAHSYFSGFDFDRVYESKAESPCRACPLRSLPNPLCTDACALRQMTIVPRSAAAFWTTRIEI